MSKIFTTFLLILVVSSFTFGQSWLYDGAFPDTSNFPVAYGQGLAVDGAGKIWYTPYYSSDSIFADTTGNGVGDEWQSCRAIYVYNPDGTPAAFSPIKTIDLADGTTDTLWNSNRGLRTDNNGDIVAGSWCIYYRFSHLTGEGVDNRLIPYPLPDPQPNGESIVAAAFDAEGNMFTNCVVCASGPIRIFDDAWDLIGDAIPSDSLSGYSRNIQVSPSGKDIYFNNFTGTHGIIKYHSDLGVDGVYTDQIDYLLPGLSVETSNWRPGSDQLWLGSTNQGSGWTTCMWYALDTTNYTIVDSCEWQGDKDGAKPRGTAFSADGMTMYLSTFNTWNVQAIQKFHKNPSGIGWTYAGVLDGYTLSQNYPNPFNPTTDIRYSVGQPGHTTLRVYNMLGQEVATLVDGNVNVGTFTAKFDATNLASGVYVYTLVSGNRTISKRMTLLK